MCGIVGFNGYRQAAPILLEGLSKLEYRGYDSAGLAVRNGTADVELVKAKGRLRALYEKTNGGMAMEGTLGIGHTRWATHGEPSETNAHPHCSDDRNVVAVHNGIIENYKELQEKLLRNGFECDLFRVVRVDIGGDLCNGLLRRIGIGRGKCLRVDTLPACQE